LQSIDALSGIAALGVVLYHAVLQTQNGVPNNLFQWPVKLGVFLSSLGYIGVFLFFVISGFCIHLQWAKTRASGVTPIIQLGSFWRRRFRRLYPPYIIALAPFLLLAALSSGFNVTQRSDIRSQKSEKRGLSFLTSDLCLYSTWYVATLVGVS